MQDATRLLIHESASVLEALTQLDQTRKKALIVVDDRQRLKGTVVDGDLRRGFMKGLTIKDAVALVMNNDPTFITEQMSEKEANQLLSNKFKIIPVVAPDNRVIGYYSYKQVHENENVKNKRVTILGMGYVGLTLGALMADSGFNVCGFDTNERMVEQLWQKKPPFYEEGLDRYLNLVVGNRLKFTTSINEARADVYIITVGTPLVSEEKLPNLEYIRAAVASIGSILEKGDLVILRSTVPVGCSRDVVLPAMEKASGLKAGEDFMLAVAPERTAEGVALKELEHNPQIVGALDQRSFETTSRLFHTFTPTVIDVESLEAAELCKLIDNSFRDHLFSFANQVARLTELLGLDLNNLIRAVNYGYSRNEIPVPSPGVGGPCLSKDPYILGNVFEQNGLDSSMIFKARKINEAGPQLIKEKLYARLNELNKDPLTAKISLIGMAFKGHPETSDLRESTSVWLLNALESKEHVCAYDPIVDAAELTALGVKAVGLEEAFRNADAVVVLNNHKSYLKWDLSKLLALMNKPAVFIDTWHLFNPMVLNREKGIVFGGLGNA